MNYSSILLLVFTFHVSFAQQETIKIPKGIVYNYCDSKIVENAKKLIADNLSDKNHYDIIQNMIIIGPELWKRFKDNKKIQQIEKGNVQFHVDDVVLQGKMSQDMKDSKLIWDEFRKEITSDYIIRKANEDELRYYWSVISFDIDEPLLILETKEHNYILNLLKKDLKLMWLDEAPRPAGTSNAGSAGVVKYMNGQAIETVPKGEKETKLEKVVLLSTDKELRENSSVEDIEAVMTKTNKIFEELFKDSKKSGKIMVQFVLKKKNNEIQFSVRDDLDLEIMKEFEKRVNKEQYPNSKKEPVSFQLIYKVNSFNDAE